MAVTQQETSPQRRGLVSSNNWFVTLLSYFLLLVGNAFALVLIYTFFFRGQPGLGIVVAIIALIPNITFFIPGLYPIRWMVPGLMLITLLVIYPIVYTTQTSFTNLGDYLGESHLLTKPQTVRLIEQQDRLYVTEGSITYDYTLYQNEAGDYALWLEGADADGTPVTLFAPVGQPAEVIDPTPEEQPEDYNGFAPLSRILAATSIQALSDEGVLFGEGEDVYTILNSRRAAAPAQRYEYDAEADAFVDNATGDRYAANDETGYFMSPSGATLRPGYQVFIGLDNYTRLVEDPGLRGPLVNIFVWTVVFALLSVLTTFAVGLFMAIVMEDPRIPARKVIRSLLIIPYAIPGVVSILVWKGMLNENLGLITNGIADAFGVHIPWFSDGTWAKIAILLVNLWLGYPYMMLICSGALQAIPSDIYEAAAVDGARAWQRFWRITLPLLLVTVGPLLIASFVFNFNNYLLIEVLTEGNPVFEGSPVPAGQTDILISYTYGLAFGAQGRDYGYASAITLIIFAIVALVTLFQYRYTRTWEEVGENV